MENRQGHTTSEKQQIPRAVASPFANPNESPQLTVGMQDVRVDAAHADSFNASPSATSPRSGSQLFADAGRLFQQMQSQAAELQHREALLQEQLAQLDAEHQRFQSRRATELDELAQRRQKLDKDQALVDQRLSEVEASLRQIETARMAIERDRVDLEHRRASLRDEILNELQAVRQSIEDERADLIVQREKVSSLTASLEKKHRHVEESAEELIQQERERLWQALVTEWEDRRREFQREHDEWLVASRAEKQEIEREKAFYEAAIRNMESDFVEARRLHSLELLGQREQNLAEWAVERENHQNELKSVQAELARVRDELQQTFAREREALEREATEFRSRLVAESDQHSSTLNSEREEWSRTFAQQKSELQSERAVIENRIRFQQDYLEKLRTDLEQAQNEFRHERQVERQRLEAEAITCWRRMQQVDLYRESIEEREKSLAREREFHAKLQRAHSSSHDLDRLTLQSERLAWERERQIQQSELQRQQELLASHSDGVESKRIRLEKLRSELEETHRSTLEMRLAVEETWGELTQSIGQEESRTRVEQTRNDLVNYYRELHEGLVEQRREYMEAQARYERQRTEFVEERQKLMDWVTLRTDELAVGEERLRISTTDWSQRQAEWEIARDRWLVEKAEAENVIRKLLAELGDKHRIQQVLDSNCDMKISDFASESLES